MGTRIAKRILIVDDDQATRCTIRGMLQGSEVEPCELIEAANGTECLMAVEHQGPIDLILLDVEMPDIDGFSICRAIRTVNASVPIVFVTAHGEVKDRADGRRAGGDSYLVKPVQPASLLSLVNLLTNTQKRENGTPVKAASTAA